MAEIILTERTQITSTKPYLSVTLFNTNSRTLDRDRTWTSVVRGQLLTIGGRQRREVQMNSRRRWKIGSRGRHFYFTEEVESTTFLEVFHAPPVRPYDRSIMKGKVLEY